MRFSTHAALLLDLDMPNYYGGFEAIELDVQGTSRLELALVASNSGSNSISDVQLEILAHYVGTNPSLPAEIAAIRGDATVADNVIALTNGVPTMKAVAVIDNPPPSLLLQLTAATWPGSPNGSRIQIWASWR